MYNLLDTPCIKGVLVVDRDCEPRTMLVKALECRGYECSTASSTKDARSVLLSGKIDLVICETAIPGMDGVAFMRSVKADQPYVDFIIMTENAGDYSYVEIVEAGASDYMKKPLNLDSAIARIKKIEHERTIRFNLKKTNNELADAMEKVKQASQAKGDFFARMSHDIRTPLNGIMGYTEILLDTCLSPEQQDYVESTKKSCDVLLSLVNDILDFSRVEAGEIGLNPIEFDPEVLCFDCLEIVGVQVDSTKVELVCHICDTVPGCVLADPNRFRQVLLNLLGNAAKFTLTGVIELTLDVREERANDLLLCACVRDTGIGIPESALEIIFEPFQQVQEKKIKKYGGTGLGLSICKKIARQMGGEIRVESQEGKGSMFEFTARVIPVEKQDRGRIHPVKLGGRRVLLIAATPAFGVMVSQALKSSSMGVDLILHDKESLALLEKPDMQSSFYDVGVIDLKVDDELQQLEVVRKIRQFLVTCSRFPLIACASPGPGEADMCQQAGFDGFLPKPVQARKLISMIAGILGMETKPERGDGLKKNKMVTTHLLAEEAKRSASILLVDDNPVNQKMAKIMLSKAGYRVTTAGDGMETLDRYKASPNGFDLILMDVNMPKMDGFETTKRIRALEAGTGKRIPIIAFTANVLPVFEQLCLKAGMDDFLTKPVKREDIFAAVKKWVLNRNE